MLIRFCLYGFLKNQRYFEPFLVLFLRDQGQSFTRIGLLVALRELVRNLLEIPSGALADLHGRRRVLAGSFACYVGAFLVFATGRRFGTFALAMSLYATGDALRTGTHKAMIFAWLRREGRLDQRTRVYGLTRSWSKLGSATSVLVATCLMVWHRDYGLIFVLSSVPSLLDMVNVLGYPAALDGAGRGDAVTARDVGAHLRRAARLLRDAPALRRLIGESMTFEGVFGAAKDYLQPVVRHAALALPLLASRDPWTRTALLIGAVYLAVHLLSATASRQAHRVAARAGGERPAIRAIWLATLVLFLVLTPLLRGGRMAVAVVGFVVLYGLQNVFRPVQVGRFQRFVGEGLGATILSVESQARSLATMVAAPLFGLAVDATGSFWPVAALGAVAAGAMLILARDGDRSRG